jgi:TRAP-type C4-dicarboxylate transport system permease small subunit
MIFELLITLEVAAFTFLALGLLPYGSDKLTGKVPLLNKIIFVLTAAILFFMLSLTSASYDYNYCYINETITDFSLNSTLSTATCSNYAIYDEGLVYLNLFLGFFSLVVMIILVLFALASRHDEAQIGDYDA